MPKKRAELIGFVPVNLDENKFVDDSGRSKLDRRVIPDRRSFIKDASPFTHLRNALRRKNDRDMLAYLNEFSGNWDDIHFQAI